MKVCDDGGTHLIMDIRPLSLQFWEQVLLPLPGIPAVKFCSRGDAFDSSHVENNFKTQAGPVSSNNYPVYNKLRMQPPKPYQDEMSHNKW